MLALLVIVYETLPPIKLPVASTVFFFTASFNAIFKVSVPVIVTISIGFFPFLLKHFVANKKNL